MRWSARRLAAEFVGTLALVAAIVGSGIAAAELTADPGGRLAINAGATSLALVAILTVLGPISGAHLHPLVSIADAALGHRPWADVLGYVPAQFLGGIAGAVLANLMFARAAVTIGTTDRATPAHLLAEVAATAGLLAIVLVLARSGRARLAPVVVAAYIGAAYFATSSTSFANPAVTIARMFSDTFAGIAPASAVLFLAAQLAGGAIGVGAAVLFVPRSPTPDASPRSRPRRPTRR